MTRLEYAGRRFAAAEQERRAALSELTDACAARPDLSVEQLADVTHLPVAGLIAVRMRLQTPPEGAAGDDRSGF